MFVVDASGMARLGVLALTVGMSGGAFGCASTDPAGVSLLPELATSCSLAGVAGPPIPSNAEVSTGANSGSDGVMSPDDELARVAQTVPGGFGGFYLDGDHRLVIVLVDPSQRSAAVTALSSWRSDINWSSARVVKGEYDFAQLKRYFDRVTQGLTGPRIHLLDIDEGLNRVVLGVDDADRERAAIAVLALGDVPCGAVIIERDTPGVLD